MSLNFDVSKIEDCQTVCYDANGEFSIITQSLVWACLSVEIGVITEANCSEFWSRANLWQKYCGAWYYSNGKPQYITKEHVVAHIRLSTNVPTRTRRQWLNGMLSSVMNDDVADMNRMLGV